MKYYVAGGAVRDLLLGRPLRDADYLCIGTETEFIQRNPAARKTQTSPFAIYLLNGQEFTLLDTSEEEEAEFLTRNMCERDLTINALLLSDAGVVFSHPYGIADLRDKTLRPASPESLLADPVRIYRLARFSASLPDFTVHDEGIRQMQLAFMETLLPTIAAEQVGNECIKACKSHKPGNFLRTLSIGNCLAYWFDEFKDADHIPAGPQKYHNSSVLEHTARVMDATAALAIGFGASPREKALAVWMALCHDLGKNTTPPDDLPRHIGHEHRGEALALGLGSRLRLPSVFIRAGGIASALHMKGGRYASLRPGTKVDLLMRAHTAGLLLPFALLTAADSGDRNLPETMRADLDRILPVSLPLKWRNKGAASGQRLRELRCRTLTSRS